MFVLVRSNWFELVRCMEVVHMKIAEQTAAEFVRNFASDSHCRS